jgi:hypothetical protein
LTDATISLNGKKISLTDERWQHITDGHPELSNRRKQVLAAVAAPERILQGGADELLAVKRSGARGWLVVVYKETEDAGFIITAFRTTRKESLDRRQQLWP